MNNRQKRKKTSNTTLTTPTPPPKQTVRKVKGTVDNVFVESIVVDGLPAFITKKRGEDSYEIVYKLENEVRITKPWLPEQCAYEPYSFTKEEINKLSQKRISIEELLDKIYYIVNRFIFAKQEYKTLIAVDILLSYAQEHLNTIHFPFAVGETESGKSSIMILVKRIGYRPLYVEGINKTNMYNFLGTDEEACGIIVEDEAQELYHDKAKINFYKNSYARGSVYPVMTGWEGAYKRQLYYKTFCQKWLAGEYAPDDKGFVERLAKIFMMSGKTEGNIKKPTKEELVQLQELRKMLMIWKIQNIDNKWADIESGLRQRDQELWEDFLAITWGTKYYNHARKTVDFFVSQRSESMRNSREAYLFENAMEDIQPNLEIRFEAFWQRLAFKERAEYDPSTIATAEHGNISKNIVSKILIEKFQAVKSSTAEKIEGRVHKITSYKFDREICKLLAGKYKLELPLTHPIFSESGQSGIGDIVNPKED